MKQRSTSTYLKQLGKFCFAAGLLCAASAQAGTASFDFTTDPTTSGTAKFYNNAQWWFPGSDVADPNNGYLSITEAVDSQRGVIVFEDIDNGQVIKAFTMEMKIRAGNGEDPPADGFSINYARANDPLLQPLIDDPINGTPGPFDQGQNCEANLPEEGTQTGIGIGFDTWDSGGTAGSLCDVIDQSIGPDVRALTVRVDGILVAQIPLPTVNGACNDATSLQTGPIDPANPGSPLPLCWAPLKVVLDETAKLSVYWKNVGLLTNYQTTFQPGPGRIVFGGRTGGNNQLTHVDDVVLTTIPAAQALIGNAVGSPSGFTVTVNDSGASVVDTNAPIDLKLNNAAVTPTLVTKVGGTTTIIYAGVTPPLASGSTNLVNITVRDTLGAQISGAPTFVVPAYITLPEAWAQTTATSPGFLVKPYKTEAANPNQLSWTEEQLLGQYGPNVGTQNSVSYNGVLDFSNTATPGSNGQFPNDFTWDVFGLPTADPDSNNSSLAAMGYVNFPTAGVYTFGGNSDDGIRLAFAPNSQSIIGMEVPGMTADVGRGISPNQNQGSVYVTKPGYYPMRLLWENGTGGADLEFYTRSTPAGLGTILVNDSVANAVKVFSVAAAAPAYVSSASPVMNKGRFNPGGDIAFQITDAGTTVQPADVAIKVDGAAQTVNATKAGNVTTASVTAPSAGWAVGSHTIDLTYGTSAYNYKFTVADSIIAVNAGDAAPLGSQDSTQPGANLSVAVIDFAAVNPGDGIPNQADLANAMIAGTVFPWYGSNAVDTATATNEWTGPMDFNIVTSAGDFQFDNMLPGISAINVNLAARFSTWIEFPTNGVYRMGVSSDDGYRVAPGLAPTRQVLHVSGAGVDRDVAAVVSTTLYGNGGFGPLPPVTPITAPVVFVSSNDCGNLPNLAGKIAVADVGLCSAPNDAQLVYRLQTNGALAAIIINAPGNGFPYVMGGAPPAPITIPAVNVSGFHGERDMWITNANLTASIGASQPVIFGSADYGKGMGWIDYYIRVPQAGLYPTHVIYEQGGGGAGFEWAHYDAAGTRHLVNNLEDPASLRLFQAVTVAPKPTLTFTRTATGLSLTYTGTLTSSDTANGTYSDVQGASSPYPVNTSTGSAKFYRARN